MTDWPALTPAPDRWDALIAAQAGSSLLQGPLAFDKVAALCAGHLVYLATPYSREVVGPDGKVDWKQSGQAAEVAAAWALNFAAMGVTAVSPIVLAHGMMVGDDMDTLDPLDAPFWTRWCRPLLDACPVVVIPPIHGWQGSAGIWHEATAQLARNRRVLLVDGEGAV